MEDKTGDYEKVWECWKIAIHLENNYNEDSSDVDFLKDNVGKNWWGYWGGEENWKLKKAVQKQRAPAKVFLVCELGSESGLGSSKGSQMAWGQYPYLDKFFPCHYPYKFFPFQTLRSPVYPYSSLRVFDPYP